MLVGSLLRNPNTPEYWDQKWTAERAKGVFKGRKYRLLSFLFPRALFRHKPRRRYYPAIAERAEGTLLDVACGLGGVCGYYAAFHGGIAVGLDRSPVALEYARRELRRLDCRVDLVHGVAECLPFPTATFDTVFVGELLEHVDDEATTLAEAFRVLRPLGKLLVTVPRPGCLVDPTHVREYSGEDLCRSLGRFTSRFVDVQPLDRHRQVAETRKWVAPPTKPVHDDRAVEDVVAAGSGAGRESRLSEIAPGTGSDRCE